MEFGAAVDVILVSHIVLAKRRGQRHTMSYGGGAGEERAMELKGLRLYLAVLKYSSITQAAQSVNVAQPSISLQLRKLEEELGLTLLERHSRGIQATEAGMMLAKHAEMLIQHADDIKMEMSNYAEVPSGKIVIGLTHSAREAVAFDLVDRVTRDFPEINLTIKEAHGTTLADHMASGRMDAALVYNALEVGNQLVHEPLAAESMYFVYPLSEGLREGPTITFAEAMKHKLILPSLTRPLRANITRAAENVGVTPNVVHEIDSMAGAREFVAQGLGYSVLPRGVVAHAAYEHILGSQLVVEPQVKRVLYLAYPRRRSVSKAVSAIISTLKGVVEAHTADQDGRWQDLKAQIHAARPFSDADAQQLEFAAGQSR